MTTAITTEDHITALRAMTTRQDAETYVADIKGQSLADLAKAACATGTAADKRDRIVQRYVGSRLAFAAVRAL